MTHICERCFNCRIKIKISTKRVFENKEHDKLLTKVAPRTVEQGLKYSYCKAGLWEDNKGKEKSFRGYPKFKTGILKHIKKCFAFEGEEGELDEQATCKKYLQVQKEGEI